MSCRTRQRDVITRILTLAGLHDTIDSDDVVCVGQRTRRLPRRGQQEGNPLSIPLHDEARLALGITGHAEHTQPSWVSPLLTAIIAAMAKGNRRAFLTFHLLTGGWERVIRYLTRADTGWLLTAQRLGISIPETVDGLLATPHPVTVIGRFRLSPTDHGIVTDTLVLNDILDALIQIDATPSTVVHTVTPLQMLRFLFGAPMPLSTDLHHVVRAMITEAQVFNDVIDLLYAVYGSEWRPTDHLFPYAMVADAIYTPERSLEETILDSIIDYISNRTGRASAVCANRIDLRNLSPSMVWELTHAITCTWNNRQGAQPYLLTLFLTTLAHILRKHGQDYAVHQMIQALASLLDHLQCKDVAYAATVPLIIAGIVHPPDGDILFARLGTVIRHHEDWSVLMASAVYAMACHQIGHVPFIDGLPDLIRDHWETSHLHDTPSPFPLLAIGREQSVLLPHILATHDIDTWVAMIIDCINAIDMIHLMGGDPQALQRMITELLTSDTRAADPRIVIRLAASPRGQAILPHLSIATTTPAWTDGEDIDILYRHRHIIRYLVSPWWETAPSHLSAWHERTVKKIATSSRFASDLANPLPLYPTIPPWIVMASPHLELALRTINHPQWETIPDADRRACLTAALKTSSCHQYLRLLAHARTTTALGDMCAIIEQSGMFSDAEKQCIRSFIDTDIQRSG